MQFGKKNVRRVGKEINWKEDKSGRKEEKNGGEKEKETKKEGNERKEGRQDLNKTLFIIQLWAEWLMGRAVLTPLPEH